MMKRTKVCMLLSIFMLLMPMAGFVIGIRLTGILTLFEFLICYFLIAVACAVFCVWMTSPLADIIKKLEEE